MCVIRVLPHVETFLEHEVSFCHSIQNLPTYTNRKESRLIANLCLCSEWRIEDRTKHRQRLNSGFRSFTRQRQISYLFFLHFDI